MADESINRKLKRLARKYAGAWAAEEMDLAEHPGFTRRLSVRRREEVERELFALIDELHPEQA